MSTARVGSSVLPVYPEQAVDVCRNCCTEWRCHEMRRGSCSHLPTRRSHAFIKRLVEEIFRKKICRPSVDWADEDICPYVTCNDLPLLDGGLNYVHDVVTYRVEHQIADRV